MFRFYSIFNRIFLSGIILTVVLSQNTLHSEELWSHITETTSGNGYHKKVINLALQLNYIHFRPAEKESNLRVLVMMSSKESSDRFYQTILEKFNPKVAVLNYKFDLKSRQQIAEDKERFKKARIKQYIKQGNLFHTWPPLYTEAVEIKQDLASKNFTQKILLLTGNQSGFLKYTEMVKDFTSIIIVSPDEDLLSIGKENWGNKQVLWIGAYFEKDKLEKFQTKFGGKVLTYERFLTGQNLLMRNIKVLDDISSWMSN